MEILRSEAQFDVERGNWLNCRTTLHFCPDFSGRFGEKEDNFPLGIETAKQVPIILTCGAFVSFLIIN